MSNELGIQQRLLELKEYSKHFRTSFLKDVFWHYATMTPEQLQALVKAGKLTNIELTVVNTIIKTGTKNKECLEAIKYFHARLSGTPETKISHSGSMNNVNTNVNISKELTKSLSVEQLRQIDNVLTSVLGPTESTASIDADDDFELLDE